MYPAENLRYAKNINKVTNKKIRLGGKIKNMSPDEGPPPPPSALSGLFSEMLIVLGVLLAILLIWIGQLIGKFGTGVDMPKIAFVLKSLGAALSSGALIGGAILNRNINERVRLAMCFIAGLIILVMLAVIA